MAKPKQHQRSGGTAGQRPAQRQAGTGGGNNPRTGNGAANGTNGTNGVNRANGATGTSGATGMTAASSTGVTKTPNTNTPAKSPSPAGSAAMRQRVQARRNQRRYEVKRAWYQGPMLLVGAAVAVVVIVGIFIAIGVANSKNSATALGPVPANVLNAVGHPNAAIFDQVGAGTSTPGFKPLASGSGGVGNTDLPPQNGKPVLFYVGAEYCPYCAANRWALVMALNRFGTFSNLKQMTSSGSDVYPNTPTFTFVDASYSSQYLAFDAKETEDRDQNPLQSLTSAETTIISTYDNPPYVSQNAAGGIPFVDFGGQYFTSGVAYDVGVLHVNPTDSNSAALSYNQIVSGLASASNPIAQAIVGTANQYTAAICKMTNDSNKSVCSSSTIQSLESKLPQR